MNEVVLNILAKKSGKYSINAYSSYGDGIETRKKFTLNVVSGSSVVESVPVKSPSSAIAPQKSDDKEVKTNTAKEKVSVVPSTTTQKPKTEEPKSLEKQATTTEANTVSKEVKKENVFVRAWKHFFSWF